jgi:hypothetical protein
MVVLCAGSTLPLAKQSLDEAPYKLSGAVVKLAGITFRRLAFSYWIDYLGFITEGKLAAISSNLLSGFPTGRSFTSSTNAIKFSSTFNTAPSRPTPSGAAGTWEPPSTSSKTYVFDRGSFTIGNGESTRFWEDTWMGNLPLAQQYPSLYTIAQRKQVLVSLVLSQMPLNIGFRQALSGNRANRWIHLCL